MKRMASVVLFLILAASAFLGILDFAHKQAAIKAERQNPSDYVTVYTDIPPGALELLNPVFFEESGIKLNVVYLSTDQLASETSKPDVAPCDIFISSQDSLNKLKENNRLQIFASARTDTALNLFKDEECYWTGIWVDPVIFAVNKDYSLKHPAFQFNWPEVLTIKSVRLSVTDFIAASMAEDLLMCMTEHFGIEETMWYLTEAQKHIVQYGKYLSTPSRMAAMGKCDIGISGFNEAVRTQKENMPLEIVFPEDGSPWYLYGAGISKDAQYPERGQLFLNWLLDSPQYKNLMEKNNFYYIYVNDLAMNGDNRGTTLNFWNLQKKYYDEGKKDLLNQWGEKIRFGGKESD
ncbi:ABC transporter substrate-binding protein [Dialister sp.]|uniref:ABC transporter substrate-binding protein n=1 Tax=Dialister sp. TaxID=1955814 RepID=UPI002E808269|nr:extracellular solute-binding protein [Dialister sp.]MEE3451986.1 extracellular solute-binding protein [Dialister sp.]